MRLLPPRWNKEYFGQTCSKYYLRSTLDEVSIKSHAGDKDLCARSLFLEVMSGKRKSEAGKDGKLIQNGLTRCLP